MDKVVAAHAGFRPHTGQEEMVLATHRHRVVSVAVGRRWGKTEGAKYAILDHAPWAVGRRYKAAYCAPTYKRAKPVYEEFRDTTRGLWEAKSDTDMTLDLRPMLVRLGDGREVGNRGGRVHFWSLEEHDNLRGSGLDFVVIDECADVEEAAYRATLTPMTADTAGHFLLIGTPKRVGVGAMWFRREWMRGWDREAHPNHYSMKGPSEGNPFLDREVLRQLRDECVDVQTRREEYDAEFLDDEGAVFERIGEAFSLPWVEQGRGLWVAGRGGVADAVAAVPHVMGLDFGRFEDFTVASVFRLDTREQVAVYRVNGDYYEDQLARIHDIRARYRGCAIVADETGVGAPLVERLRRRYGDGVVGRKWGTNSKEEDVTRARQLFQRAEWRFLDVPWQRGEFMAYQRERMEASGRWRYQAPSGGHDDAVAAACLAAHRVALPYVAPREKPVEPEVFSADWIDKTARWMRRFRSWGGGRMGGL